MALIVPFSSAADHKVKNIIAGLESYVIFQHDCWEKVSSGELRFHQEGTQPND